MRPWVKSHKKSIQEQEKKGESSVESTIGRVRGQPLLTEEVLDLKLRSMLLNLWTAGVLNGLIRKKPERFGSIWILK